MTEYPLTVWVDNGNDVTKRWPRKDSVVAQFYQNE